MYEFDFDKYLKEILSDIDGFVDCFTEDTITIPNDTNSSNNGKNIESQDKEELLYENLSSLNHKPIYHHSNNININIDDNDNGDDNDSNNNNINSTNNNSNNNNNINTRLSLWTQSVDIIENDRANIFQINNSISNERKLGALFEVNNFLDTSFQDLETQQAISTHINNNSNKGINNNNDYYGYDGSSPSSIAYSCPYDQNRRPVINLNPFQEIPISDMSISSSSISSSSSSSSSTSSNNNNNNNSNSNITINSINHDANENDLNSRSLIQLHSRSSSKRKLDELGSEISDLIESKSQIYVVGGLLALKFPELFYSTVNNGDISMLKSLTKHFFHPDCVVSLHSPVKTYSRVGTNFISQFYEALLSTHPDGVVSLRKVCGSEENGVFKIKCNIRFRGTRVHEEYFNKLLDTRFESIFDLFDLSKLSLDEMAYYIELERERIATGKKIVVFVKIELTMYLDLATHQIKSYSSKSRLSSFRLAEEALEK